MNLHHFVMFSCYWSGFNHDNSAVENLSAVFAGELTNPLNILRKIFDRFEQPKRSALMSKLFAVSFIPIRGFICPYICYDGVMNPQLSYVLKVNSSLIGRLRSTVLVGFVWIWRIVNLGVKQLATENPSNQSFQKVYAFFKKIRPYEFAWNILSASIPSAWLFKSIYFDIYGWPSLRV